MSRWILLLAALVLLPACKDDPTNPAPDDETPAGRVVIYDTDSGSAAGTVTSIVAYASAGDGECNQEDSLLDYDFDPILVNHDLECSATDNQQVFHRAAIQGTTTVTFDADPQSLLLTGINISASAQGDRTRTGLASCGFKLVQNIYFRVEDAPVKLRALGSMVSGDAINDEFRLSPADDLANPLYRHRGRDGNAIVLDEAVTLEPGRYLLTVDF